MKTAIMGCLSPLKAIRRHCLWCGNGQYIEVKLCTVEACPLYLLRFGKGVKGISPLKAIRKKCFDCGEGTAFDIKNCIFTDCSLYSLRFGKNPNRKGIGGGGSLNFRKIAASVGENSKNNANQKEGLTTISEETNNASTG